MSYPSAISSVEVERNFYPDDYLGIGKESKRIQEATEEVREHFSMPISMQTKSPLLRFNRLKHEWIEATKVLSSISEIVMHPAYQSIIGMGKTAIPFIIKDLIENTNHWFWALKSITGEDPVPPDKRGKIKEMTNEWVMWWFKKRSMDEW